MSSNTNATSLTYDPTRGKIIAAIYEYGNNSQLLIATNYSNAVEFDCDGNIVTATPVNGMAAIDFNNTAPGNHVIKTTLPNCDNGSLEIVI